MLMLFQNTIKVNSIEDERSSQSGCRDIGTNIFLECAPPYAKVLHGFLLVESAPFIGEE